MINKLKILTSKIRGKREFRGGQMLVESVVAISIVMVGLLGIISLLVSSSGLNRDLGVRLVATNLAVEGVEVIKSIIDKNISEGDGVVAWNDGLEAKIYEVAYDFDKSTIVPYTGRSLLFDSSRGVYGYSVGALTVFNRMVDIKVSDATVIEAESTVRWLEKGQLESVSVEDKFTFWRR